MAAMTFQCSECDAQLTGPARMQGKKVRCKKCGATIVLSSAPAAKSKPGPKGATAKSTSEPKKPMGDEDGPHMYAWLPDEENQKLIESAKVAPIKSDLQPKYDDVTKNPYGLTKLDETLRCPFCAKAMDEGAIVCLHCGYNTQTRSHGKVVRTIATTPAEQFMWSLPGILGLAGIAAVIFGVVYLWTSLPDPNSDKIKDEWYAAFIKPAKIWGSIIAAGLIYLGGILAFKRLIKAPKPPEKLKR